MSNPDGAVILSSQTKAALQSLTAKTGCVALSLHLSFPLVILGEDFCLGAWGMQRQNGQRSEDQGERPPRP